MTQGGSTCSTAYNYILSSESRLSTQSLFLGVPVTFHSTRSRKDRQVGSSGASHPTILAVAPGGATGPFPALIRRSASKDLFLVTVFRSSSLGFAGRKKSSRCLGYHSPLLPAPQKHETSHGPTNCPRGRGETVSLDGYYRHRRPLRGPLPLISPSIATLHPGFSHIPGSQPFTVLSTDMTPLCSYHFGFHQQVGAGSPRVSWISTAKQQ